MTLLAYDIIAAILDCIEYDLSFLAQSSLVNKEFNVAASKLLYRTVVVSPPPKSSRTLNLKEINSIPVRGDMWYCTFIIN